jgi:WD repeat-containing protein 23
VVVTGDFLVIATQDERIIVANTHGWSAHQVIDARDIRWTITSTDVTPDDKFLLYTSICDEMHLCNIRQRGAGDDAAVMHETLEISADSEDSVNVWCAKFSAGGQDVLAGCSTGRGGGRGVVVVYDVERKAVKNRVFAHAGELLSVGVPSWRGGVAGLGA